MATLINRQTNEKIILQAKHTFGRDLITNITVLKNQYVSRNHAVWTSQISLDTEKPHNLTPR